MKKEIIAFDIDDVICDTRTILKETILSRYNFDIKDNYFFNIPGKFDSDIEIIVNEIINEYTLELELFPGVLDTLSQFHKIMDFPIIFLTGRNLNITGKNTMNFLRNKFSKHFPFLVFFGGKKSDKIDMFRKSSLYYINFFVEDELNSARKISGVVNKVFLINRDWNKCHIIPNNVYRIDDFNSLPLLYSMYVGENKCQI